MAEANEVLARRLGLAGYPSSRPDDEDATSRLHWKMRRPVEWATGRRFIWVDDEITDTDRIWVAANHSAPALLHRVDPHRDLTDTDYWTITQWLKHQGLRDQDSQPPKS